jgi:hypothetical protein
LNHRNASKVCFIKDFWAELRNKVCEAMWEAANPTEKLKKENVKKESKTGGSWAICNFCLQDLL